MECIGNGRAPVGNEESNSTAQIKKALDQLKRRTSERHLGLEHLS